MSTRHDRKLARNERFARMDKINSAKAEQRAREEREERERWEAYAANHPVSANKIPLVEYVPPTGRYIPAMRGELEAA